MLSGPRMMGRRALLQDKKEGWDVRGSDMADSGPEEDICQRTGLRRCLSTSRTAVEFAYQRKMRCQNPKARLTKTLDSISITIMSLLYPPRRPSFSYPTAHSITTSQEISLQHTPVCCWSPKQSAQKCKTSSTRNMCFVHTSANAYTTSCHYFRSLFIK